MYRYALLSFVLTTLAFVSDAGAQCTDSQTMTDVAEGETNPTNPCQICRGGMFEYLPEPTRCGESTGFMCDESAAFLEQCVEIDMATGETECRVVERSDSCPSGYACDVANGVCAQTCNDDLPCGDGYECVEERCERILPEPPDMGALPDAGTADAGAADMGDVGGTDDVGIPADMGTQPSTDAGGGGGGGGLDSSDEGCCAVVTGARSTSGAILLILGAFAFLRARSRQ